MMVLMNEESFEGIVKRIEGIVQAARGSVDPQKEACSMIRDLGIGRASEQLKSAYYTPDSEEIGKPIKPCDQC